MEKTKNKILWVDDEIELLRSNILFLEDKGYYVDKATNGEDYIEEFNRISMEMMEPLDYSDWIRINSDLTEWEMELDEHPELGLKDTVQAQRRECNIEFSKYFERNYVEWIHEKKTGPIFSNKVVDEYV